MFCTSLRRRSSFASTVPSLISTPGLILKESQLESHDIAVRLPKPSPTDPNRTLRLLLLSPTTLSDSKLSFILKRIEHFACLTGGIDIAIILLLTPTKPFASAKSLTNPHQVDTGEGLRSYTRLQSELLERNDLPLIPVLPLYRAEGLAQLIKSHMHAIGRAKPELTSGGKSLDLVPYCTTELPLPHLAVMMASDVFSSMSHLVQAAITHDHGHLTSSVAGMQEIDISDSVMESQDPFNVLKEQCGEDAVGSMLEFWADDFVIE